MFIAGDNRSNGTKRRSGPWARIIRTRGIQSVSSPSIRCPTTSNGLNVSGPSFDAVQSGACQALILDVPIIEAQNAKQPDAYGGVVGEIDTNEGYGAVFAKDSPLIPAVSKAIKTLDSNGTIAKLTKQWFGYDPSKIPVLQ